MQLFDELKDVVIKQLIKFVIRILLWRKSGEYGRFEQHPAVGVCAAHIDVSPFRAEKASRLMAARV